MNRLVLYLDKEFEKENNKLVGRLWKEKVEINEILYNCSKDYAGEEFIENYVGVFSKKDIKVFYDLGEEEYDLEKLYILKQYGFRVSFHYFKMYDSEENINAIKLNIKKCLELQIPFRLIMSDEEYDLNDPIYKFIKEEKNLLKNEYFDLYFCYENKEDIYFNRFLFPEEINNINIETITVEENDFKPFEVNIEGVRLLKDNDSIEEFEERLKEIENDNLYFVEFNSKSEERLLALYEINKNYYAQLELVDNEVVLNTIKFDGEQSVMYAKKVMLLIKQLRSQIGVINIYLHKNNTVTYRALEFYSKLGVTEFVKEINSIRKYKSR